MTPFYQELVLFFGSIVQVCEFRYEDCERSRFLRPHAPGKDARGIFELVNGFQDSFSGFRICHRAFIENP